MVPYLVLRSILVGKVTLVAGHAEWRILARWMGNKIPEWRGSRDELFYKGKFCSGFSLKGFLECFLKCLVDFLVTHFLSSVYFSLVQLLQGQCVLARPGFFQTRGQQWACVCDSSLDRLAVNGVIRIERSTYQQTKLPVHKPLNTASHCLK